MPKSAIDYLSEYNKEITALATGAIVLSIAFLKDLSKESLYFRTLMILSWVSLTVTVLTGILLHLTFIGKSWNNEEVVQATETRTITRIQLLTFVFGIILLTLFIIFNFLPLESSILDETNLRFALQNITMPFVVGILASLLASYLFLKYLIKSKPKIKIYSSIVITKTDPHYFVVIFTKEKETIHLKIDVLLSKEIHRKVFYITVPLWQAGYFPYFTTPILVMPVKLHRIFFDEIKRQQGTYKFINDSLLIELERFLTDLGEIASYDDFSKSQRNVANVIFRKLFKEYGVIKVVMHLEHKKTGLKKIITRVINEIEDIEDLAEITTKKYSEIF